MWTYIDGIKTHYGYTGCFRDAFARKKPKFDPRAALKSWCLPWVKESGIAAIACMAEAIGSGAGTIKQGTRVQADIQPVRKVKQPVKGGKR